MKGFKGTFTFNVDEKAKLIDWENVNDKLKSHFQDEYSIDIKNSKLYQCNIIATRTNGIMAQKNHAWEKVKRIFIHAQLGQANQAVIGIFPKKILSNGNNSIHEIGFGIKGGVPLFDNNIFNIDFNYNYKFHFNNDSFKVIGGHTNSFAQWVFSENWDTFDFMLLLCINENGHVFPGEKYLNLSIRPTVRKNKELNNVSVKNKKIWCQ